MNKLPAIMISVAVGSAILALSVIVGKGCAQARVQWAAEYQQSQELKAAQRVETYQVWCKLNNVTNLTYKEWDVAERNRMLPEQKVEDAKQTGQLGAAAMGAVGGWVLRSLW